MVLLGAILTVGFIQSRALAFKGDAGLRKMEHKKFSENAFFRKVKMIYRLQEELGVTDEQLATVNSLKVALKKDVIMKNAKSEVIDVDIKAALYGDDVDVEAVDQLIDKKYAIKVQKAKKIISFIAELKKVLTPEQKDKLKMLVREYKPQGKWKHRAEGKPAGCPGKEVQRN